MKQKLLFFILYTIATLTAVAETGIDFKNIKHWAGNGSKSAALVIQFNDGKDDCAYVWGYRWDGYASGEDMIRAVARTSSSLTVLIQNTGSMGYTLDGVGLSTGRKHLDYIEYDFQKAAIEGQVSFNYFEPNTLMGQTSAPGNDTPGMVQAAIDAARTAGVIEHPLSARRYGYPAYDYDFWQLGSEQKDHSELHWQAGWYDGYWSYWIGTAGQPLSDMAYSGLGMSSAQIEDGSVNLWNFNTDMTQMGEAPQPSENINYDMAEFDEKMNSPQPESYAVDFDRIDSWTGEGEKFAAVVVKFNDGKQPDNLVYGYRWSGGWDDKVSTVLKTVLAADKRFSVEYTGNDIRSITYDTDSNQQTDASDHCNTTGIWDIYGDFAHEPTVYQVGNSTFVNPRAVIILTCTPEGGIADYSTENLHYADCPTAVTHGKADAPSITALDNGSMLKIANCRDYSFTIADLSGHVLSRFVCDSDATTVCPETGRGIFIIHGTSNHKSITTKFIVK